MKHYTDLTYLQELTDNDGDLIIQILRKYSNNVSTQLQGLLKSTEEQDWEGIHNSAHSLFSTTQIIGLTELAQLLKDIQLLAKEKQDFNRIEQNVKKANHVINISYKEVEAHLEKLGNS